MTRKLRDKGFDEALIRDTVTYLHNIGLMDDVSLASDLYRIGAEHKSLGKRGIRMFLAKRGIDRELIDTTLSDHTPDKEIEAAREFAERKYETLKKYPEQVIRRRLWGMLQRRGFSAHVVHTVINSVL